MSPTAVMIQNSMVESTNLHTPPLEEIAEGMRQHFEPLTHAHECEECGKCKSTVCVHTPRGPQGLSTYMDHTPQQKNLKSHFEEVQVEVTDCPDLTEAPFTLACKGLTGKASIVEVGGVPYLLPRPIKDKLYDLRDISKVVNLDPCYITGAGAGPWPYAGTNCEMMINLEVDGGKVQNKTRIAKVDTNTGSCQQEVLPDNECRSAVLSNLYCSLGQQGKVLKISCTKRIGKDDFVTSIRKSLASHFTDKCVGLGGVFVIKKGKVKQHVMPDFSNKDINSDVELNNWLKFYEMNTPLIAVGTLVNKDPGLDLRLQHFHSFSHHGEGGHYHIDTTPNDVEYLAYFGLGEKIYRIDRPKETHGYGRD